MAQSKSADCSTPAGGSPINGTRRAIDIREGELPDAEAFKALITAAVAENQRLKAR